MPDETNEERLERIEDEFKDMSTYELKEEFELLRRQLEESGALPKPRIYVYFQQSALEERIAAASAEKA
jgi:hypothetical protein